MLINPRVQSIIRIFINQILYSKYVIIKDRSWGEFEVNEGVLVELVNHPELERLKKISQFGLPYKYYPIPGFDRYEHSVGVMLLLRKLGASLDEQAAGLLHDLSHTAFSHLVDWVIGNRKEENYQDLCHKNILAKSGVAQILQNYGFSPENIAEHERYTLLEQPSPQ